MRTRKEFLKRIEGYKGIEYIYTKNGYIAWQLSTGENIEIMFIEVREIRKGHGQELMRKMVAKVKPFHSIFVFRLASNEIAGNFYRKLGFKETIIKDLYRGQDAVLSVIPYEDIWQM